MRPLVEKAGKPDVVVIDPPRAGLSQKIVRRVIECEAKRIVYVSCNPTTLAPNAAQLVEAGYRLRRVRPVDMFPQTPHIECVALFEKAAARTRRRRRRRLMGRGFGVAAGLDPEVARPLAARCAELGYDSIWSNDHPGAKGLETLAEFAAAAPEARPRRRRDRPRPHPAGADRRRHRAARPRPGSKLWLGVGAGFSKKPLTGDARVAAASCASGCPASASCSPRWGRRCARSPAAAFDGAFFNWMTPEFAAGAREKVEAGAAEAGRETPPVFGYVRTAVGPDAAERLAKEESFYRDLHNGYRDHFDRLGEPEGTVGVAAADAEAAQTPLAAYTRPRHHRRPRPRLSARSRR